ncbi:MAG TPA: serine/threonine-protein kinase, partial [Gemmatirosa sp.]
MSGWSATAAGASAATTGPTAGADDGAASGADNGFAAALAAALLPGLVLERELVGGAMARVFVAREVALDRRVVAKVLPPTLAAGINRERFRREIQLAAQLQHPHIVPLLSAGEVAPVAAESAAAAAGSLYYTMPFIEGESLRAEMAARAARGVPFTAREVLRILRDVAEALGYAHGRGVVHRDVKPGNVLLQHGHALVTDFGVAKALASSIGGAPAGTMTTLGMAIGTPAYMAPEQLAADPAADQRMDLYATGLVAYELLSGVSPFAAASPQATLAAQLTRVPADIAQLRPDVPPALAAVVMQCLAKDAADRPQTAEVLLAALDAVGETSSASRASGEPARRAARIAAPAATRSARSRSPIVAAAVLAVAAAGAVATRAHPREERPAGSVATTAPPANPARPAPSSAAAGRPTLSSADSAAIAAAVERQFERAALRHAPPPTAAPQRAPWPLAVAPSESAALGRAARAA